MTTFRDYYQQLPSTAGSPSVLVAYGQDNAEALKACSIQGQFIKLR